MADALEGRALEERARRAYAVFTEEGLEPWFERFAYPDVVWDTEPLGLGVYEGQEAYGRFFEDWISSYDTWSFELEQLEVVAPGMTVTSVVQRGCPRGTDQEVEFRWGQITLWEGDRVRRIINFENLEEARTRAAELGES